MRASEFLARRIEHVDVARGFCAAHRRGEIDVETKLIAGPDVSRRIDALDAGNSISGTRRPVECFLDGRAA